MKILEFGAGTGLMLGLLKRKNYNNIQGVEISKWACQSAKKNFGIDILNVDISDANFLPASFDIIHSITVIEHLRDPILIFKQLNKFLKTGGYLIITTANGTCFNSRVMRSKWRYFIPNEHIFLFNKKSIKLLLNKSGFEIIKIKNDLYEEINFYVYLKQLTKPIILNIYRRFVKKEKNSLNNFITSKDGLIVISRKVKDINA